MYSFGSLKLLDSRSARIGFLLVSAMVLCTGCSVLEWVGGIHQSKMESSELKPYLDAASRSRRGEFGFTPLPSSGPVGVEIPRAKTHYDAMLHIYQGSVSRTVDFLVRDGSPEWSGEQEIHYSPREFETVDGTIREFLVISHSTVEGSGTPTGGYVQYWGPDSALKQQSDEHRLSVADAKRLWDDWPK